MRCKQAPGAFPANSIAEQATWERPANCRKTLKPSPKAAHSAQNRNARRASISANLVIRGRRPCLTHGGFAIWRRRQSKPPASFPAHSSTVRGSVNIYPLHCRRQQAGIVPSVSNAEAVAWSGVT